jgi:hypothetical protein
LVLQVFIGGDKSVESSFLDQRQKLPVLYGAPALPRYGRDRISGKMITNLSWDAFIKDDPLQDWS